MLELKEKENKILRQQYQCGYELNNLVNGPQNKLRNSELNRRYKRLTRCFNIIPAIYTHKHQQLAIL